MFVACLEFKSHTAVVKHLIVPCFHHPYAGWISLDASMGTVQAWAGSQCQLGTRTVSSPVSVPRFAGNLQDTGSK